MNLNNLLRSDRQEIIDWASESLARCPLKHYRESDPEENKERLSRLFDLAESCIHTKNLIPMMEYSKKIGEERYRQHFDLEEVHVAFNVLEEAIWTKITEKVEPKYYPQAFGMVSTVLGFGKETLAVTYVSLSSQKGKMKSLNLSGMFQSS
ncbi:hypothetical protein [Gracilimonas mengyeensis]|uniref:RsbT co-antagonist protein rsbRD N-terminal domain-containing protein n=1 Tax=Gracilimonas mengyeensis TaxID=1302730 RepID=A0A521E0Y6_9BACT|nr:hypothetical protein [Gracilimonas mengyeensis]SMO77578.1 hypothetical protein SAMN06265219_11041 [Gracilimonas mengyeensis]